MDHQETDDLGGHNAMLFARTYPLTAQVVPTLVAFLRHFKWNSIALIKNVELNAFQMKGTRPFWSFNLNKSEICILVGKSELFFLIEKCTEKKLTFFWTKACWKANLPYKTKENRRGLIVSK